MKNIIILLISILVISCKSNPILTGEYQATLPDSTNYTFNLSKKQFTHKWKNGKISKGRFRTLIFSSEKSQLVCNEMILKKTDGFITETNASDDSIVMGVYDGYQRLGQTVFEITSKGKTLLYRKTYSNQLQKTESEGVLIKH
ncbi:hypothetical protein D3C87_1554880 [compost metagenome]